MSASAPAEPQQIFVHATAVAVGLKGVLLLGPSGSGKSDLALRLIDQGARLVADDQVVLSRNGARLIANAPPALAGKIDEQQRADDQQTAGERFRRRCFLAPKPDPGDAEDHFEQAEQADFGRRQCA